MNAKKFLLDVEQDSVVADAKAENGDDVLHVAASANRPPQLSLSHPPPYSTQL